MIQAGTLYQSAKASLQVKTDTYATREGRQAFHERLHLLRCHILVAQEDYTTLRDCRELSGSKIFMTYKVLRLTSDSDVSNQSITVLRSKHICHLESMVFTTDHRSQIRVLV